VEVARIDAPHLLLQSKPLQAAVVVEEFLRRLSWGENALENG
jgi:hypothetical protein